jgi:hypothetical protein
MKISLNINITFRWVRIPVIPFISFAEVESVSTTPEETVQTTPAPEAEILPIPTKPAQPTGKGTEHTKEREYDPDKRYRRGMGPMAGTEAYRAIHVKRDLIQWFTERNNKPLSLHQLRTMKKSPFNHAWQKCELTCTHRVANDATLRRVLRNARTEKEKKEGIPQVITFVKKKRGFTLDKDFYKSMREVEVLQYESKAPTIVANWVKENSELRR